MADPLLDQILGNLFETLTYDEDCLRLSLTLPADYQYQSAEQLPVLVWVHGGSYVTGAGDLPLYNPARLVSEQRVVFVAITYRLGLLGFLGSEGGPPPNLGLLDILAALGWVQRNVAAFGGDPALVTLLGAGLVRLLTTVTLRAIYQAPAQTFARRHGRGGAGRRVYKFCVKAWSASNFGRRTVGRS